MQTLFTTIREVLRYKGREGQWLWVLHRISGLGILFYLIIHVYDMSLAYFNVPVHESMIALFKTPVFSVLELVLGALLIFHAVNGVRVALLDLRPDLWTKQQLATRIALVITAIIIAPTLIIMVIYTLNANFGPAAAAIAK
jgi:succinate dehydrogenase / fumarate reductase cytochrome b subunit